MAVISLRKNKPGEGQKVKAKDLFREKDAGAEPECIEGEWAT